MAIDFVDTFIDDVGRTIGLTLDDDIVAYEGDKEIGRFVMTEDEFDDHGCQIVGRAIKFANIEPSHQQAGIGTQMTPNRQRSGGPLVVDNWSPFSDKPAHYRRPKAGAEGRRAGLRGSRKSGRLEVLIMAVIGA